MHVRESLQSRRPEMSWSLLPVAVLIFIASSGWHPAAVLRLDALRLDSRQGRLAPG